MVEKKHVQSREMGGMEGTAVPTGMTNVLLQEKSFNRDNIRGNQKSTHSFKFASIYRLEPLKPDFFHFHLHIATSKTKVLKMCTRLN